MNATPPKIARNQNIAFHPRYWANMPPKIGDKEGPRAVPTDMNPMYAPRSAEVTQSAATPLPIATMPLLPTLCRQRSTKSAA